MIPHDWGHEASSCVRADVALRLVRAVG
ncbi:hypothetical protein FRIGORI9N_90039 [Frigoribacterium sp. 9N]|nr:hypothetical protein FRIGORI9N_90039 [Frigoribacterium sp. 9N]